MDLTLAGKAVAGIAFPEHVRAAAESAAYSVPGLREQLAANPGLSEQMWDKLYPAKKAPKGSVAEVLVRRKLTRTQIRHVITTEGRSTILTAMLDHNILDREDQQAVLAAAAFTETVGKYLLRLRWIDADLSTPIALAASGMTLLEYLAGPQLDTISDTDLAKILLDFPTWGPQIPESENPPKKDRIALSIRARHWAKIVGRRPQILAAAVNPGQNLAAVTAAAGSARLLDVNLQWQASGVADGITAEDLQKRTFGLLALVNNPVVQLDVVRAVLAAAEQHRHTELIRSAERRLASYPFAAKTPYGDIEDPELLRWIVKRIKPREGKESGRPFDAADLAGNPNLNEYHLGEVRAVLNMDSTWEVLGDTRIHQARALFAQTYPDHAPEHWATNETCFDKQLRTRDVTAPSDTEFTGPTAEVAGRTSLAEIARRSDAAQYLQHACDRLGDDPARWNMFLSLLGELDGETTLDDLVMVCEVV